jgi:hypothetical protein
MPQGFLYDRPYLMIVSNVSVSFSVVIAEIEECCGLLNIAVGIVSCATISRAILV